MRFITAGESHGENQTVIVEGLPANLRIEESEINFWLAERQKGYGRGGRMKIEKDQVHVTAGLRNGRTLGSPLCLVVHNKDWKNWEHIMHPHSANGRAMKAASISRPRPGHADLAGAIKYEQEDIRNILERSSARETTARTLVGAVAISLLGNFGVKFCAHVIEIGGVTLKESIPGFDEIVKSSMQSEVRCISEQSSRRMIRRIERAKKDGDTLGGLIEVRAKGLPVGIGSHVQWDRRLEGQIAQSVMSVQAIKAVEIGAGRDYSSCPGSSIHDEIIWKQGNYRHLTNNAGGIEGGMTNGEELVVRAVMKPIPTLLKGLGSVDMKTHVSQKAKYERSDVCAVPAAAIVVQSAVAFSVARAFLEKFGGDSLGEIKRNYQGYMRAVGKR